jgi:purine-nucleoside phosphorylase
MFWPARGLPDAVVSSARGAACYDAALGDQALAVARRENFAAHRGVYVAMSGPNYETRAEYRALRKIGGDVVGMSTVPEAVAASCCGLRTVALSVVTNLARPDRPHVTQAEDVVDVAAGAEPKLRRIILDVVSVPWPSGD